MLFGNSNVIITVERKRHLRATGSDSCKREYVHELTKDWKSPLCILSIVAES